MLCIFDYNPPSDDDVDLPRGRMIAHANICMIRTDRDNEDTSANVPVASVVDEPVASVIDRPVNVSNDMYQLCVDALINDVSVSTPDSPTNNYPGYRPGIKYISRLGRYI